MFNFSANHLLLLSRMEYRTCAVLLMRDDSTPRVYRLHDFTKSQRPLRANTIVFLRRSTAPTNSTWLLSPSSQTPSMADIPQLLLTLTARESGLCSDTSPQGTISANGRSAGGRRRRVLAGPPAFGSTKTGQSVPFIPALTDPTVITAIKPKFGRNGASRAQKSSLPQYNLYMRGLLLICLAGAAFAQVGKFGAFTGSDDVGAPPIQGSAEFDVAKAQYRITGSGTDIWGKADQFHYVWREISGDFAITATAQFLTEGNAHRKAVIMLRKTLDADSPFVHLVIHGDGMPGVQFRNTKGGNTNTVDLPIEGAGSFKLKLVRQGNAITVFAAKEGGALRELGHTNNVLGSPILAGLGVSSHTQAATNTVLFSDVMVEQLESPAGRKQ